ncbi:putative protein OS=Bosea thiooxidans OX=53254 GN=SAMN05660750_00925 PE=4 SV=1 [Bosea thiooxidans]|uniref:Uncharacterized protein n=2 Tax=Bosea thiooxidans TaxID=53254 RepID=A0A1T5BN73_9HYPH|nr:hypothetical protein [Bosea thiooxidans]SKB48726.1 hypothetical protein SAMN05660750_00925 [Bosea thiooxidans]
MRRILMAAGLTLAALAATPAGAAPQSLPQAEALDRLPAEYTRHTREHRMWEIQRNVERQQRRDHYRYGRGYDRRYDRGYGYGRRHGGPPPHAPAHGYRQHRYYR